MSTIITGEAKKSFKAIVVKELPEKGILNNLYFVLNGDEGDNKYDEYIWVKDPDTQQYMWEKVGYSYVDLTPYYTKEEVDGKLSPINNNLLKLNTETTFHPVININQIKPGGGQGTNKDRWTIDQAVLAAWEWINEDLTNRGDYLSPGISIMFRSTNLRDVNGFDGAWLIHNYSDVDFSQVAFTNPDKWCRVLTEADFKFEAADETYSGFLLNTDYIKFNNAVKSITAHVTNYNNPHQVTKDQVGLGNVDNTADLDKPLSNNDKAALDLKIGSISIASIGAKTLINWYGVKENAIIGGQQFSTSLIGTTEIPVVSELYNGLFPASKYSILSDVPIIKGQVNTIEQKVMGDMGTSVITLDNEDPSALNTAITQGYSLIRISDGTSKAVTIINEGDGTNFTQYKYEGGQQYVRYSLTGSWLPIGPITYADIVANDLILYRRDRTGNKYAITSSQVPVLGSDAESCGFLDVYDYNRLKNRSLILPENGITQTRTTVELGSKGWVNYNDSSSTVESIYISSATTSKAGVMTSDQVSMLDKSISTIVPTPSSDRITLKLKQNNGGTSDMPLGLVNTTNAGLMSPTDKSKLDGIESLASSDITALFS